MEIKPVNTDKAPAPIGPYSQAVRAGNFLFLSGQIAIDPQSGDLVLDDFVAQSRRVLENTKAVLEAAGSGVDRVVKVTVFLKDLSRFGEFNAVYAEYFDQVKPARSCVEVSSLPKGVDVEIDVVAISGEQGSWS